MKRILAALMAALMLCAIPAAAEQAVIGEISAAVNGEAVEFDVLPQIIDGKVMVPMRFIFEKLGATVMYDDETQTISSYVAGGEGEALIIIIQIDNPKAFITSGELALEAAPILFESRTLVTLDLIEQAFGADVVWDADNMIVSITKAAKAEAEPEGE